LDALRARAFATRRPELLHGVYASAVLFGADADLLTGIVPPGCGLVGMRTRYSHVRGSVRGARAIVTAVATLSRSRLVCGGRERGTAPGAGPVRLRLEMGRGPHGRLRIVAERPER
jgi:hypothetical protein